MITWDDSQSMCQTLASDPTASSLTFFKLFMNQGYKIILNDLGRPVTERIQDAVTVAGQQFYQMPPDFLWVKTMTVTVGGIAYVVQEEESQEMWDYLNQSTAQTNDIPQYFFIRPSFGFSGAEIGFYPAPASAGNAITMVYEATDRDFSVDKYITGTVTVSHDDEDVVGSGTNFSQSMVGRYFKITSDSGDAFHYRIVTVSDAEHLKLENVYEGDSGSGLTFSIHQMFALPEDIQILPIFYALSHYYGMKRDQGQEAKYLTMFNAGLKAAKTRYGTKSRSEVIRSKNWMSRFPRAVPPYFPGSIS